MERRPHPSACVASRRATSTARSRRSTWAAEHDFVGLCLGNTPVYGPKVWGNLEYNDPAFEAFWSLDRGDRAAGDLPRVDGPRPARGRRQRRRDHQLRLPLDGDDDRAARAADHVGRVRAPSPPAGRPGRVRHRVRAVVARDDGLRLPGAPLLGAPGHPRAAVDVLPPPLLRDVPGGPRRPGHRRAVRPRRQPDVGERLPAPRGVVAALGRIDRAADGRPHRRVAGQDPRRSTQSACSRL